ncbi:ChaN family lipoprotein [Pseudoalteromonas rubra]|uniref:ChaN family lipoprotein n=1 Tax=Pseudoalteromonas rubra TaxID=43658 RepID=UPI000F78C31D|nr:ChaN family lipoprotein [Pseudoalteromonas rubra]
MNKLCTACIVITFTFLSACSLNHNSSPSQKLIATEGGWQLTRPLLNLYDYELIDVRSGKPVVVDLSLSNGGLLEYDVVFIGENHSHPGNHLAQAVIYQRMLDSGEKVILSMEQFERDVQPIVDDYLSGKIGEWSLRHFARAWENYKSSYRPVVEMAKQRGLPVIAANAPKDIVVCIGREGLSVLDKLPAQRKNQIAASFYMPEEGAYFEKFTGSMGNKPDAQSTDKHSKRTKPNLNTYHAQVVRDDTMAESIDRALAAHPKHKLVHLNGHFHSASGLGTVERLKLRRNNQTAVIQPVMVSDANSPSFSDKDMVTGDYLLLIYALPEQVKTAKNQKVWMKNVFKRSKQDCSFGNNQVRN